jgi:hypothetical protein
LGAKVHIFREFRELKELKGVKGGKICLLFVGETAIKYYLCSQKNEKRQTFKRRNYEKH